MVKLSSKERIMLMGLARGPIYAQAIYPWAPSKNPHDRAMHRLVNKGLASPNSPTAQTPRFTITPAGRAIVDEMDREYRERIAKLSRETHGSARFGSYPRWTATYSNEAFDRAQHLAYELTDADRRAGKPGTPKHGYSAENFKKAEKIVRAANAYASRRIHGNMNVGYRVAYLTTGARRAHLTGVHPMSTAMALLRQLKRRGLTVWIEDERGTFVPVPGAKRKPGWRE